MRHWKSTAARDIFLESACRGDEQTRLALQQLLDAHMRASERAAWSALAIQNEALRMSSVPPVALAAGTKLGPYEIIAAIGAGGVGEVYRPRDTRLGRDVAIKVCAELFNERFEREARAVAALNHPNICHLYEVGPNYLVMELIEGQTLAARLARGPLPPDQVLALAMQIAGALAEAQRRPSQSPAPRR